MKNEPQHDDQWGQSRLIAIKRDMKCQVVAKVRGEAESPGFIMNLIKSIEPDCIDLLVQWLGERVWVLPQMQQPSQLTSLLMKVKHLIILITEKLLDQHLGGGSERSYTFFWEVSSRADICRGIEFWTKQCCFTRW